MVAGIGLNLVRGRKIASTRKKGPMTRCGDYRLAGWCMSSPELPIHPLGAVIDSVLFGR